MDTNDENQQQKEPAKTQEEIDREFEKEGAREKKRQLILKIGGTVCKILAPIFMVIALFFTTESWVKETIFAMFAYIFVCIDYYLVYFVVRADKSYLRDFIISVAPAIFAIIVPFICKTFLDANTVWYVGAIVAGLLLMAIEFNFFYFVKKGDLIVGMKVLDYNRHPKHRKIILHVLLWSSRVLTVIGCLGGGFFGAVGVIIWVADRFYERYLLSLPYNDAGNDNSAAKVSSNANGNKKSIGSGEVREIVRKIADKWNNKLEVSFWLAEGGMRYKVSYQIDGCKIIYNVDGKFEQVRENKIEEAKTLFTAPMRKAVYNIKEETEKELSKYRLPMSFYSIQVNTRFVW